MIVTPSDYIIYKGTISFPTHKPNPEIPYNFTIKEIVKYIDDYLIDGCEPIYCFSNIITELQAGIVFLNYIYQNISDIQIKSKKLYCIITLDLYSLFDSKNQKAIAFSAREIINNKVMEPSIYWN